MSSRRNRIIYRRAMAYRVDVISTSRTFVRPVVPSIISLNGIGTKWPPCIEIIAALPPPRRYFAAQ